MNLFLYMRRLSQQLGICYSTPWQILIRDLHIQVYNIKTKGGEWALQQPRFRFSEAVYFYMGLLTNKIVVCGICLLEPVFRIGDP